MGGKHSKFEQNLSSISQSKVQGRANQIVKAERDYIASINNFGEPKKYSIKLFKPQIKKELPY